MRIPAQGTLAWLNGEFMPAERLSLPLTGGMVEAGLGVFETMAVRHGWLLDLDAHISRLLDGARYFGVPEPDTSEITVVMRKIAVSLDSPYGWLKIVAGRPDVLAIYGGLMDRSEEGKAVSAILLRWRLSPASPLAGTKSLNYAPYVLGAEEATRRNADEGIWLNSSGMLGEGCSSSLFVVQKGKVYTPSPRDGILPGIVRDLAIRAGRELGYQVHEGKIRLKRLEQADEAFLTSSLRSVRPLVTYEGKPVGRGVPGPVTAAIGKQVAGMRIVDRPESDAADDSGEESDSMSPRSE